MPLCGLRGPCHRKASEAVGAPRGWALQRDASGSPRGWGPCRPCEVRPGSPFPASGGWDSLPDTGKGQAKATDATAGLELTRKPRGKHKWDQTDVSSP